MALREIQTLSRNNANVQLTNAVTDESNDKLIGNFRPPTEYTSLGDPYKKITDLPAEYGGGNPTNGTVDSYARLHDLAFINEERTYIRGTSGIILTFEKPVPNFYISAITIDETLTIGTSGNPLGVINAYDSDGVIIFGIKPALPNGNVYFTVDGVEQSQFIQNLSGQTSQYIIKKANGNLIYQFAVENRTKLIKKVVLEPAGNRVWYQSIDWNRPVPPPPPVINTTQGLAAGGTIVGGGMAGLSAATGNYFGNQNFSGGYGGNHTHGIEPNPHIHNITPDPHTHQITPNPHRHGMRFAESGSFIDTALENSCRVGPEVLINLIYNSLNTETEKEKSRVSNAAKKGNWITANKIGKPIWDYLENYYIRRVICYLQSRVWYTEYETLTVVPTDLDVLPTGLIASYHNGMNTQLGAQGTVVSNATTPASVQQENIVTTCVKDGECVPITSMFGVTEVATCEQLGLTAC